MGVLSTFTVADFVRMPITAQGQPAVVAGRAGLDSRVRWLHVAEPNQAREDLQGGELILTTGVALPPSSGQLIAYVDDLADQGAVGLVIELGQRMEEVPAAMARTCERRNLPLIVLRREVPFVKITEAAHALIMVGQQQLLQITAIAHERFTELGRSDAPLDEMVATAGELAEGQVIFSNLMHQVIALDSRDESVGELLGWWRGRASCSQQNFGTIVDQSEGSVVVPVDVRGKMRGLLALLTQDAPTAAQVMVMERAAAAIAVRLLGDDDETLIVNARRTTLTDIISRRFVSEDAMHARTASLGHPTKGRQFLPLIVLAGDRDAFVLVNRALGLLRIDALTGELGVDKFGALLLLPSADLETHMEAFAVRLHEFCRQTGVARPVVAFGGVVTQLSQVGRSFAEAADVALSARACEPFTEQRVVYRIGDIQLRGLLYGLRGDPRVQAFVDRMLGSLLARDARDAGDRLHTLAVYLKFMSNKSLAADALGISRPTLYERLGRIERLLCLDLEDPETSASLYAAVMLAETLSLGGRAQIHQNIQMITKLSATAARN